MAQGDGLPVGAGEREPVFAGAGLFRGKQRGLDKTRRLLSLEAGEREEGGTAKGHHFHPGETRQLK